MPIKAILYDLDGVLVSAVEMHRQSFDRALQEVSGAILSDEEHNNYYNGLPTNKKIDRLIQEGRVKVEDKEKIFQLKQFYTKESIPLTIFPSKKKDLLHQSAAERGIKICCVTNSIKETAELMLQASNQLKWLDLLISNQQVREPKPSPEGYRLAMKLLNLQPDECLIVEDSPHGIAAAKASGATVLEVEGPDDVVWDNVKKYIEL